MGVTTFRSHSTIEEFERLCERLVGQRRPVERDEDV
jgi:hypothetical protein